MNFEILIPKDDSVRLLSQITEGLDYRNLAMAYSIKGRNPAIPPKIMFQVLVYAYMNKIYSTRKIEEACKRDINFMWLMRHRDVSGVSFDCIFNNLDYFSFFSHPYPLSFSGLFSLVKF